MNNKNSVVNQMNIKTLEKILKIKDNNNLFNPNDPRKQIIKKSHHCIQSNVGNAQNK